MHKNDKGFGYIPKGSIVNLKYDEDTYFTSATKLVDISAFDIEDATRERIKEACVTIKAELEERLKYFRENGKLLEAERLEMRTNQDMESMPEFGMCPGIEN